MARKSAVPASADDKVAYLKSIRNQFETAKHANQLLQKRFGSGLIYGVISRELKLASAGITKNKVKRGPGRPKGSGMKRGPGRPKGSKNATVGIATGVIKRGPGRPKGSGKKRGPGRPKGSKNAPAGFAAGVIKRGPGRPRKDLVVSGQSYVVSTPRGRGFQDRHFESRDAALAYANAALERGIGKDRIRIYSSIPFQVRTQPSISF